MQAPTRRMGPSATMWMADVLCGMAPEVCRLDNGQAG